MNPLVTQQGGSKGSKEGAEYTNAQSIFGTLVPQFKFLGKAKKFAPSIWNLYYALWARIEKKTFKTSVGPFSLKKGPNRELKFFLIWLSVPIFEPGAATAYGKQLKKNLMWLLIPLSFEKNADQC